MTGPGVLDPAAFAGSLQRERSTRGWSLRQAGLAAGVHAMTVLRAERGADVRLSVAVRLAGAYRTGLDTLLNPAPEAP